MSAAWRPEAKLAVLERRAQMNRATRRYFEERNVLEVDTPALSRYAVTDPNLHSLVATDPGWTNEQWFLHTSPEFGMKRLLAAGAPDIYQLCHVFRGGESGRQHQREFTMLEWYRLGYDLEAIIQNTLELILEVSQKPLRVQRLSYREALLLYSKLDIFNLDVQALNQRVNAAGLDTDLSLDAKLDWLMVTDVLPGFQDDQLTVLNHYPASQAALARLHTADERVADRFEVFYGAMELANGFVELCDANEQQQRFENEQRQRREQGATPLDIDPEFISALQHGLPECAGVALGMDRLLMLITGNRDISDVMSFPSPV
ncbi:MAG: EF-P lysine aminoacylase EpmA [Pseudomonadota bacterium]